MTESEEFTRKQIARKLARAIADDAEVDWASLGLDPSALPKELDALRRLSRVANSFERFLRADHSPPRSALPAADVANAESVESNVASDVADTSGSDVADADCDKADVAEADVAEATPASGSWTSSDSPHTLPPTQKRKWGRLEILSRLGEGSFGTVYLAFDPMLEREVALKLWKDPPRDSAGRMGTLERDRWTRRLLEEGRRMAKVRHPNVATVYGADVHGGRVGFWTERLEGETLADLLARRGPMSRREAAAIGASVADALSAAHAAGVLHGDVKESNLAIEEGRVVLFDFGSGRNLVDPFAFAPLSGTPFCLAPEVLLDGAEPDASCDLYAVGVLLHRLTTGRYPIEADSLDDLIAKHRSIREQTKEASSPTRAEDSADNTGSDESARETAMVEELDASSTLLRGIIARATGPDPAKRYESAAQMARDLRFLLETAPESVPARLPASTTRFFGREEELSTLRAAIRANRLVTLAGPGGCGKSRLALEAVRSISPEFADGVYWIELAPLRSESMLVPAILHALGFAGGAFADQAALVQRLASRVTLLVLDNAEHLAADVRKLAEHLLSETERTSIVVTSRKALGGARELLFRVHPLPVPVQEMDVPLWTDALLTADVEPPEVASVALFFDRARRRDPGFDGVQSRRAVEKICTRLEGLPLAIEIAAARSAALGVEEIARQLKRPLQLGEDSGAEVRHRSLRHSISWSFGLLPPEAQMALRRWAVFANGWSVEAAIEVGNRPGFEILESLAVLVEHSLVERRIGNGGRPRYFMLEAVREFAEELLEASGEAEEVRDRQYRFYFDLFRRELPKLKTEAHAGALELLDEEYANLDRILQRGLDPRALAIARDQYLDPGGGSTVDRNVDEDVDRGVDESVDRDLDRDVRRSVDEDVGPAVDRDVDLGMREHAAVEDHVQFVASLVPYFHLSGRDNAGLQHVTTCLAILGSRVSRTSRARLHLARAGFVYLLGFAEAERELSRALGLFSDDDEKERTRTLTSLGGVLTALLRFDEAESNLHAALESAKRIGDEALLCAVLTRLADLRFKQLRLEESEEAVRSGEELARRSGDASTLSVLVLIRASIAWSRGDRIGSLRMHEEALDVMASFPHVGYRSGCYSNMALLHWEMGNREIAYRYCRHAERLERRRGQDVRRAALLSNLADYLPPAERGPLLIEAFDTYLRFEHLRQAALLLSMIGANYVETGHPELGIRILAAADEFRRVHQVSLPEPSQASLNGYVERARQALPPADFEREWASGRQTSLIDARNQIGALTKRLEDRQGAAQQPRLLPGEEPRE